MLLFIIIKSQPGDFKVEIFNGSDTDLLYVI